MKTCLSAADQSAIEALPIGSMSRPKIPTDRLRRARRRLNNDPNEVMCA